MPFYNVQFTMIVVIQIINKSFIFQYFKFVIILKLKSTYNPVKILS